MACEVLLGIVKANMAMSSTNNPEVVIALDNIFEDSFTIEFKDDRF